METREREMIEVCAPFIGKGFRPPVAGVLLKVTSVEIKGQTYTSFTMRRKDGSCFEFRSQLDLDQLILPTDVGQFIVVKLDAFYASPVFSVWTSREKRWRDGKVWR